MKRLQVQKKINFTENYMDTDKIPSTTKGSGARKAVHGSFKMKSLFYDSQDYVHGQKLEPPFTAL